ncbi:MAG: hypothetical protein OEY18_02175 [Candidatus Aminicenantes bacterium]|nr:hypothetical protein [Candidatus Aminicenantes bacterium]MDH5383488.1 hypothetical protein [Candidatus Aminicenantes bacterium]MDH5742796.1 hypothetical protein [Candidatus Aminicenantes bacterium]
MKNKQNNKVFLFIGLSLFAFTLAGLLSFASELFAPKVNPPKNMANRQMWVDMIMQWEIPSKESVGIPPYPGAVIIAVKEASEMIANDEKYKTLPMLTLSTFDEPAKVAAFYKDKLKDWKYDRQFDMFDIFWKGPDDFNHLDIRQTAIVPNVIVFKSSPKLNEFMPDAKTQITIVFEPVK